MSGALHNLIAYLRGHGRVMLFALVAILLGTLAFILLTYYVTDEHRNWFDRRGHRKIRLYRASEEPLPMLEEIAENITGLGGPGGVLLACVIASGALVIVRRYRDLIVLAVTISSGTVIATLLKHVINRPPPGGGPQTSFPSRHAMVATIVYLAVGITFSRFVCRPIHKYYILFVAAAIPFLVGLTRLYLLTHWPTDVLAAWAGGAVWVLFCWVINERIQQVRGKTMRQLEASTP